MTRKDNSESHVLTQNNEYLRLSSQRLSEPPLIWVNQLTQVINDFISEKIGKYVINDIRCNVGHFARNVKLLNSDVTYREIDISKTHLKIAKDHFPHLDFFIEDFAHKDLNIAQFERDISIVSPTLEHIDDYEQFLDYIFKTTSQLVLIRTFIGETSEMDYCLKEGATQS
jgi:2-polyprenyl-3-methyl-5-hydroxy-6-metoxy-1,4-benzoquinol methylase